MKRGLLGQVGLAAIAAMAAVLVPIAPVQAKPTATPPSLTNCTGGLDAPADDPNFRVWACNDGPGAGVEEGSALSAIESVYGPMTTYMGLLPLPDSGGTAGGGDTRIDIYLMNADQSLTREGNTDSLGGSWGMARWDAINGTVSSGYIMMLRPLQLSNPDWFLSSLVHEFFHLLSFAYNTTLSCDKYWFLEASAKWAEWYFAPKSADKVVYPWFRDFQAAPSISLNDNNAKHRSPYADFIWPLFMQQEVGAAAIRNAWSAMKNQLGCPALDASVDAQLPFAKSFGHFAVRNFDHQVFDLLTRRPAWPAFFGKTYLDPGLLPLNGTAPPFPQVLPKLSRYHVNPGSAYPWTVSVPVNLPGLSAQYDEVDMTGPASVEFDFSKLANAGNLDVHLIAADLGAGPGGYVLIPVSGLNAQICIAADTAVFADVYVVLDNHALPGGAATITGQYTATARTTCADGLLGNLNLTYITRDRAPTTTTITQALTLTATSSLAGWSWVPGSTYSATYKSVGPANCPGGTITTKAENKGPMQATDILGQSIYQAAYRTPPAIFGGLLGPETAVGTWSSPCGSGVTSVSLGAGTECPHVGGASFTGSYSSGDQTVVWKCSDAYTIGGLTIKNIITGSLIAIDPMICGLWTPGPPTCPVGP